MNKIKFRGKSRETNDWVYGQLLYLGNQPFIVGEIVEATSEYINLEWWQPVHHYSVGRFTGFRNLVGDEIYEDDLISFPLDIYDEDLELVEKSTEVGEVIFESGQWYIRVKKLNAWTNLFGQDSRFIKIIGNIYENPELVKEELE